MRWFRVLWVVLEAHADHKHRFRSLDRFKDRKWEHVDSKNSLDRKIYYYMILELMFAIKMSIIAIIRGF